jgi:hypothetical protein
MTRCLTRHRLAIYIVAGPSACSSTTSHGRLPPARDSTFTLNASWFWILGETLQPHQSPSDSNNKMSKIQCLTYTCLGHKKFECLNRCAMNICEDAPNQLRMQQYTIQQESRLLHRISLHSQLIGCFTCCIVYRCILS